MWRVCGGEASLIQLCPVAHQSYLPPPVLFLSKAVSLFSPHTSLPGNPAAFSQVLSFLTAFPTAQTHSSPLDREQESRRRLVSQRQVPDIQPASQTNASTTLCFFVPSTPLPLCGLLRASAAHWRYQDPQRRAKSPFSLHRLLFVGFLHICIPSFFLYTLILHHPDTRFVHFCSCFLFSSVLSVSASVSLQPRPDTVLSWSANKNVLQWPAIPWRIHLFIQILSP